jgi:hypothetical protein
MVAYGSGISAIFSRTACSSRAALSGFVVDMWLFLVSRRIRGW